MALVVLGILIPTKVEATATALVTTGIQNVGQTEMRSDDLLLRAEKCCVKTLCLARPGRR
jgi:hypothetical protein